ncbi:NAD-binding protein [Fomitiporia mediterranea MF3/22]|uniref:NAD-binding protein n=1 Tax=Fomitiporia mediterranea (strain MF3/22) TaxID=694068 RepID=UPI0004407F93|nr:NAD-binding protein [Fomitiporia mediterranea MF3/22]EJD02822.1 NAD-binding protein [Fomitiporia mediterranea MF3/22]
MATNIPDDRLYEYAHKVRGQTVVITGAAKGIGRETALVFAQHGANVVIGDVDVAGAEDVVASIKKNGGEAISQKCDVLEYEQLVQLIERALTKYGRIDAIVANAGVSEIGKLTSVQLNEQGLPMKPNLKTLQINLISVLHTTQLAFHYFTKNKNKDSLKALVLLGSMASILGVPGAPLYGASKHALIGLMRSIREDFALRGLRVATICPFFADTAIVPPAVKVFMAGIPLVPVPRIAGAILLAATDEAPESNGAAYTLPDDREVFRIPPVQINEGVYKMLNDRVKRLKSVGRSVITIATLVKLAVRSPLTKLLVGAVVGYKAYQIALARGLM